MKQLVLAMSNRFVTDKKVKSVELALVVIEPTYCLFGKNGEPGFENVGKKNEFKTIRFICDKLGLEILKQKIEEELNFME